MELAEKKERGQMEGAPFRYCANLARVELQVGVHGIEVGRLADHKVAEASAKTDGNGVRSGADTLRGLDANATLDAPSVSRLVASSVGAREGDRGQRCNARVARERHRRRVPDVVCTRRTYVSLRVSTLCP